MTKRQIRIFLRPFTLLALLISLGCAQQMKSVQAEPVHEVSATAQIQSITVADDASRIEIISDKPIVYTYYMLESPPRVIVDIAQTSPGRQHFPLAVNSGVIERIDVAKHEFGSGVLSRIDITLKAKIEISAALDSEDKKKLVLSLPVPVLEPPAAVKSDVIVAPVTVVPLIETVEVVEPKAVEGEKQASVVTVANIESQAVEKQENVVSTHEPVKAKKLEAPPASVETGLLTVAATTALSAGERGLTAIKKVDAGLLLEFSTEPDLFKAFKLPQPERLVVDIFKTKSAVSSKIVNINAFNLGKARIGSAADKLRIVFDAVGNIPKYSIVKSGSNLMIEFTDNTKKQEAGDSSQETAKVESKEAEAQGSKSESRTTEKQAVEKAAEAAVPEVAAPVEPTAAIAETVAVPVAAPVAAPVPAVAAVSPVTVPEPTPVSVPIPSPVQPSVPVAASKPLIALKPLPKELHGVVDAIEFTQVDGVSRITIRTSGSCVAGEPVKSSKKLSLSLKGCRLPVSLQRSLDTRGFESAIKSIAPVSLKRGAASETRVVVSLRGTLPNFVKVDGGVIQWDFTEAVKVIKAAKAVKVPKRAASASLEAVSSVDLERVVTDVKSEQEKSPSGKGMEDDFMLEKVSQPVTRQGKIYTGRKVTLEFSDADIKKIFQLLAEVSNQNFLISDDVTGTISLKLVNVPWDQALDVILENKSLGMQREGNIVQIRPKTKIKSLDDEAVEMRLTEEKKMPLSTVIFDINFAELGGIEAQFKNLKSKRNDSSISSDMRTNKIIVVDIDPNINKMRKLLDQLDIPEKQVMIEARIVEASSSFARDIGVKWNFGYQDGSASIANINNLTGSMGGVVTSGLSGSTGGITTGISFGKLLSNIQLDMRLSAASTVGQVKIISTPKVLTVNNKPAKISQGQMIPYVNTTSQDGAKTEFIEAALSLEVTPHITADGSVNMKIRASNNTAGVGTPPPINKKEATTELVVKNGETTVIGGIYVDSETEGDTGVPYLSDIPLFGWLFKSNTKSKSKNEMLIFITPKIMN